jgi:hypothetical protein
MSGRLNVRADDDEPFAKVDLVTLVWLVGVEDLKDRPVRPASRQRPRLCDTRRDYSDTETICKCLNPVAWSVVPARLASSGRYREDRLDAQRDPAQGVQP